MDNNSKYIVYNKKTNFQQNYANTFQQVCIHLHLFHSVIVKTKLTHKRFYITVSKENKMLLLQFEGFLSRFTTAFRV